MTKYLYLIGALVVAAVALYVSHLRSTNATLTANLITANESLDVAVKANAANQEAARLKDAANRILRDAIIRMGEGRAEDASLIARLKSEAEHGKGEPTRCVPAGADPVPLAWTSRLRAGADGVRRTAGAGGGAVGTTEAGGGRTSADVRGDAAVSR